VVRNARTVQQNDEYGTKVVLMGNC
jgi:hypothetical protein